MYEEQEDIKNNSYHNLKINFIPKGHIKQTLKFLFIGNLKKTACCSKQMLANLHCLVYLYFIPYWTDIGYVKHLLWGPNLKVINLSFYDAWDI